MERSEGARRSQELVDTWARLFCARQVETACYQLISRMLVACGELREPGRVKDPFHTLLACVNQADSLKQVIVQARFGVDISEQSVFSLSVVTQRLHSLQDEQSTTQQEEQEHHESRGIDALQPTEAEHLLLELASMLRDLESRAIQVRMECERWLAQRRPPRQEKVRSTGLPPEACAFWVLMLGDLHLGASDSVTDWEHILHQFRRDLQKVENDILKGSHWDLIAFVGDLIGQGQVDQFTSLDTLLDEHWLYWKEKGWDPALVSVPGNHDLVRPDPLDSRVIALKDLCGNLQLQKKLFGKGTDYKELIERSFSSYSAWWESQSKRWPGRDSQAGSLMPGELPGEFAATLVKDGATLGIVGLNSAFLHLGDVKKTKSHLAICNQQFNAISGPDWCGDQDACILLTHHSPEWLHKESRRNFASSICTSGRFALHICGHLHVPFSAVSSQFGSGKKGILVNSSLCGRSVFTANKRRIHGYTVVKIERNSKGEWSYRLFPRQASLDFEWEFRRDDRYKLVEADGGTIKEEFMSSRSK